MSEEILLTQEGYDKIVAEHEELVSVREKKYQKGSKKRFLMETFRKILNTIQPRTNRPSWKKGSSNWKT